MGLEISQIKNAELIKAAMHVDQEATSENAKNGVLDEAELQLFIQNVGSVITQDESAEEKFTEILGLLRTKSQDKITTPETEKEAHRSDDTETNAVLGFVGGLMGMGAFAMAGLWGELLTGKKANWKLLLGGMVASVVTGTGYAVSQIIKSFKK